MSPRSWITIATALVAAAILAGCTEESAGSPMPDDTMTTPTEPETTQSTTRSEPSSERPREIKLDDKDPCALITQSDLPGLGIERPGKSGQNPNFKSPTCMYPGVGEVATVLTEGIEEWRGRANVEIDDVKAIEGFPTISIWNLVDERSCYTVVDVADSQYLLAGVAFFESDQQKAETCSYSYRMAESAMKTLVA